MIFEQNTDYFDDFHTVHIYMWNDEDWNEDYYEPINDDVEWIDEYVIDLDSKSGRKVNKATCHKRCREFDKWLYENYGEHFDEDSLDWLYS